MSGFTDERSESTSNTAGGASESQLKPEIVRRIDELERQNDAVRAKLDEILKLLGECESDAVRAGEKGDSAAQMSIAPPELVTVFTKDGLA